MIVEIRSCDGCGQKIEAVEDLQLSITSIDRHKQVIAAGGSFLALRIDAFHWLETPGVGRHAEPSQYSGKFDICHRCAETRTIASFKIKPTVGQ